MSLFKFWRFRFGGKTRKLQQLLKLRKSQNSPKCFLFCPFLVCFHDLHPLHEINKKMRWKAPNLVENQTNLTKRLKKMGSEDPIETTFCKSDERHIATLILYSRQKKGNRFRGKYFDIVIVYFNTSQGI